MIKYWILLIIAVVGIGVGIKYYTTKPEKPQKPVRFEYTISDIEVRHPAPVK